MRTPIHPGKIIADELEERGISATELERMIDVPENHIFQFIAGEQAMTEDMALKLARSFGTSVELWMSLQKTYEIDLARQEEDAALRELETFLAPRIAQAERGELSDKSVEEIFAEVREAEEL